MQMRMMALMAVLLAVCLVVLPLLFSNKPFQPTRMEQEQQMQPLQTQEPQQQAKQEEQQEEEQAEKAVDWEPFLILNRTTGEIEEVPVEEYVVGALCSEMPATFHTEALKAQAVSAHTWGAVLPAAGAGERSALRLFRRPAQLAGLRHRGAGQRALWRLL